MNSEVVVLYRQRTLRKNWLNWPVYDATSALRWTRKSGSDPNPNPIGFTSIHSDSDFEFIIRIRIGLVLVIGSDTNPTEIRTKVKSRYSCNAVNLSPRNYSRQLGSAPKRSLREATRSSRDDWRVQWHATGRANVHKSLYYETGCSIFNKLDLAYDRCRWKFAFLPRSCSMLDLFPK